MATLGSKLSNSSDVDLVPAFSSGAAGCVPASGGGTSKFLRADGAWVAPTAEAGDPSYPSGSFTIATNTFRLHAKQLVLATTERLTVEGTGRYVGL